MGVSNFLEAAVDAVFRDPETLAEFTPRSAGWRDLLHVLSNMRASRTEKFWTCDRCGATSELRLFGNLVFQYLCRPHAVELANALARLEEGPRSHEPVRTAALRLARALEDLP